MPIDTLCPGCQAKLRIGDEFAGGQARCPVCDTIYAVPAASTALAEKPEEETRQEPFPREESTSAETAPEAAHSKAEPAVATEEPPSRAEQSPPLPPPDGTQWFLRTPEGPIYGPVSEQDFDRWLREGRVTGDCQVSAGDNRWRDATQLFPQLAAPPPTPITIKAEAIQKRYTPHRGPLILTLGLLGIFTSCFIPSLMAWVMGSHDLEEMRAERMDPAGLGMTQAGRLLGMVFSMIYIVAGVIGFFVLLMMSAG